MCVCNLENLSFSDDLCETPSSSFGELTFLFLYLTLPN